MRAVPYQKPNPTSDLDFGFRLLYSVSTEFDGTTRGINFMKRKQNLMQKEGKHPKDLIKHFIVENPILPNTKKEPS